jgi:hypothetical protein
MEHKQIHMGLAIGENPATNNIVLQLMHYLTAFTLLST